MSTAAEGADPKDKIAVWNAIEHGIEEMRRNPADATRLLDEAIRLDPVQRPGDEIPRRRQLPRRNDSTTRRAATNGRSPPVSVTPTSTSTSRPSPSGAESSMRRSGRLSEAVKAAPHDADAWNRLGQLDARAGRLAEARRDFAAAIEAAPDCAEPRYNLGLVERQLGNAPWHRPISPKRCPLESATCAGALRAGDRLAGQRSGDAGARRIPRRPRRASRLRRGALRGGPGRARTGPPRRCTARLPAFHPNRTARVSTTG